MKKLSQLALAAVLLTSASAASAQGLTEAQARAAIAPWYSLFNVAGRGDVKSIEEQILTADYESCAGYLPANAGAAIRRSKWFRTLPTLSLT